MSGMSKQDGRYKYHPLSNVFPLMVGEEFNAFAEDIRDHGLYEEIVLLDGMILDGRNRYRACLKYDVRPRFRKWAPTDGESPLAYVVSLNVKRRMLDESQRAMVAARLANLPTGAGKRGVPIGTPAVSWQDAAEMLNVGRRSVARGRLVLQQGVQQLIDRVEAGQIPLTVAETIAKQPERIQCQAVKLADKARSEKALKNKVKKLTNEHRRNEELHEAERLEKQCHIITGDFRTVDGIADESVDLIFVDPVYPPHAPISLYDDLGEFGSRVLKVGGSLVAYISVQQMLAAGDELRNHLDYHWTIAVVYDGNRTPTYNRINCRLKPLLWFSKGKPHVNRTWMLTDVIKSQKQKSYHEWQQSTVEAEAVINAVTRPGDLVIDPMTGSGTTLVTALRLHRRAIGIEIDGKTAALARKRVADGLG